MRRLSKHQHISSLFTVFFVIIGVTSTLAISTGKKVVKDENIVKNNATQDELPTPIPSSSTSSIINNNAEAEFSSRLGTTTTTTSKKEVTENRLKLKKPSKFASKKKNSTLATVSASSKSSQLAFPESEKSEGKEDNEPQNLALELLDEKDGRGEGPESEEDGEGKYPRIYYGEAVPPRQHVPYGSSSPLEGEGEQENPKYYYPKNYVHNKHGHKGSKNKKKFEYKYEEDVRQLSDPYHLGHSPPQPSPPTNPTPDSPQYHHVQDPSGKENHGNGFDEDNGGGQDYGYGHKHQYGEGGHPQQYYHGRDTAEIISKALQLLIPSALILTGLSAVFPNRIHVPTNDYNYVGKNINNIPQRYKRSIDYIGGQPSDMFGPEHRSIISSEEIIYPSAAPVTRSYNFEIGSPRGKYADQASKQYIFKEFKEMPSSDENSYNKRLNKSKGYGQKSSAFIMNKKQYLMSRGPQNPEEFDMYHHGTQINNFVDQDSVFAPSSIATPTIAAPEGSNLIDNNIVPSSEKPKRKMRTLTKIKVRSGLKLKRKSRPLPTEPPAIIENDEFQTQLFESVKKVNNSFNQHDKVNPTTQQQQQQQNYQTEEPFRLGDAYLRSMVEHHETQKASTQQVDLSPDGAVMGLITSYAQHDRDSPSCQKQALCFLAIKGKSPNATKFEKFLWNLATLVPDQFSRLYDLDDIFKAVQSGGCDAFQCSSPNLDLQV